MSSSSSFSSSHPHPPPYIPPATSERTCSPDGQSPYKPTASPSRACLSFSLSEDFLGCYRGLLSLEVEQPRSFRIYTSSGSSQAEKDGTNVQVPHFPCWGDFEVSSPQFLRAPLVYGSELLTLCWPFSCSHLTFPSSLVLLGISSQPAPTSRSQGLFWGNSHQENHH